MLQASGSFPHKIKSPFGKLFQLRKADSFILCLPKISSLTAPILFSPGYSNSAQPGYVKKNPTGTKTCTKSHLQRRGLCISNANEGAVPYLASMAPHYLLTSARNANSLLHSETHTCHSANKQW